jgi:hypothetical protein
VPGTQVYDQADAYQVRGTHLQSDWDGDWAKFHIHHNDRQWWGTDANWAETQESFKVLRDFVERRWNRQG